MGERLAEAIRSHLGKHRLVFWYDDHGSNRARFDELDLQHATKLEIENNELWIKHHVLREAPETKFLIYSQAPRPADEHNWLLDLNLAHFLFSSDEAAILQHELDLPDELRSLVKKHLSFFQNSRERLEPLRALVDADHETARSLQAKMLSILCAKSASDRSHAWSFEDQLFALAVEALGERRPIWDSVVRHGLHDAFFASASALGFTPDTPTVQGLVLHIYERTMYLQMGGSQDAADRECAMVIGGWANALDKQTDYRRLVHWVESEIDLAARLGETPTDSLMRLDLFPIADWIIAHRIASSLETRSFDAAKVIDQIELRSSGYWPSKGDAKLDSVYRILNHIVELEGQVGGLSLLELSRDAFWAHYTDSLWQIDLGYREVLRLYQSADAPGFLSGLVERTDRRYVHQFLQPMSEHWETLSADGVEVPPTGIRKQRDFFQRIVAPELAKDRKLFVVISDGLRYDIGRELAVELEKVNRFEVSLDTMMATIPSETAFGMSALLPFEQIELAPGGKAVVDGRALGNVEMREAILQKRLEERFPGKRALAFRAEEFSSLSTPDARDAVGGADIVYLYSSRIDATGDNAKTERALPAAAHEEIRYLTDLCRRIANNLNRTHILVTADHGFLFQDSHVDDTHLVEAPSVGKEGTCARRFAIDIVGPQSTQFHHFTSEQLGYGGSATVSIPKGLCRIRKQGGGSRYVHGGTSLHELCIPVIRLRKSRSDDLGTVDVQIMKAGGGIITSATVTVSFYQDRPVDSKTRPRRIRAVFQAKDDSEISDTHELVFDSDNPIEQNRGRTCTFTFAKRAVAYNNTTIYLALSDIRASGHAVPYLKEPYRYRIMGELDFQD